MTQDSTIVIVGAGQAGGSCAVELRKRGHQGQVVLVGDEPYVPYKRPPLSKTYLAGEATLDSLYVLHPPKLEEAGIECRCGARVTGIDRKQKTVALDNGETLAYDKLVLATGGSARPLNIPGADLPEVFLLRTIADVDQIKTYCQPGRRVAIVGGGFIGLEAAAVTSKLGLQVTVLEGLPRVLSRVTSPEVSSFYEAAHREAGVDLRTGVAVTAFERGKNGIEVVLGDEDRVEADFVIIGIGLIPHTELAAEAGLTVGNGIVVDEFTRTSDPDIFAVGDCSNHPNALTGGNIRLESVQNAMEQGRAAAHNLSGEAAPYQTVPWFWSDQYDLKLQMAGLSAGHDDHVLRGDPAARSFSVFYLREGRLIASDSINRPKDFMMAKRLVAADCRPTREQLEDENRNLKSLLPAS